MQVDLVNHIVCAITGDPLHLTVFESHPGDAVVSGVLEAGSGMFYPIAAGVARLLPESFLEHEKMLLQFMPNYGAKKQFALQQFGQHIARNRRENDRTKKSFSKEWQLLEGHRSVDVWNQNDNAFEQQLRREIALTDHQLQDLTVLDIGCGHGKSSQLLAQKSRLVIGLDLGESVVAAEKVNRFSHCHYIQADLQYLPFKPGFASLAYSSGVLHHTPDTRAAFGKVAALVKPGGWLVVWLYKPYRHFSHRLMLQLRKVTPSLPLNLQWWLYAVCFLPVMQVASRIRGHKRHWRTQMINLMDMLSPKYRTEQTPDSVSEWFSDSGFGLAQVTTTDRFGFSMSARKKP